MGGSQLDFTSLPSLSDDVSVSTSSAVIPIVASVLVAFCFQVPACSVEVCRNEVNDT